MFTRALSKTLSIFAVAALMAGPAAADPGRGTSTDDWKGLTILQGGKGYVDAPLGQLHYRDIGPRNQTPMILLHQSPMMMIQWGEVQNELAAMGIQLKDGKDPATGEPVTTWEVMR